MNLSPAQSLGLLLLVGLSVTGWFYGIYWKRVASGTLFTKEERVMVQLHDQIRILTEKNTELNETIHRLTNPDAELEAAKTKEEAAITPGVLAPFEKVELPRKGF